LRLGKLVPFAFARFLVIFFIGVAATLAWQSYGATAREMMASWSPHLGFLAPPPAPVSTQKYDKAPEARTYTSSYAAGR
jgi:hypothetical protein